MSTSTSLPDTTADVCVASTAAIMGGIRDGRSRLLDVVQFSVDSANASADSTYDTVRATMSALEPAARTSVTDLLNQTSEGDQSLEPISGDQDESSNWLGLAIVLGLLTYLGISSPVSLGIVLAIVVCVFLHELGHFMTARWTGMKATEFFIGFGPRVWSFKRGETTFGIKPILAGAYVRIIGMTNLEDVPLEDEPRTYRQQSYPKRVLVASAGSIMHFIIALLLFFVSFGLVGLEREDVWTVTSPSPDSAAESVGLMEGDTLVSLDGESTSTFNQLIEVVAPRAGATVALVIERNGDLLELETTIGSRENPAGDTVGFLGVGADYAPVRDSIPRAAYRSFAEFPDRIWDSLNGIGQFAKNIGGFVDRVFTSPGNETDVADGSRPISVIGLVQIGSQLGASVIWLLAMFNVFIGVFNLLPLLPLDGGHIAIATYERIRSRNGRHYVLDVTRLLPLTYAVFAFLVFFGIGAVWLDIANPITL